MMVIFNVSTSWVNKLYVRIVELVYYYIVEVEVALRQESYPLDVLAVLVSG